MHLETDNVFLWWQAVKNYVPDIL